MAGICLSFVGDLGNDRRVDRAASATLLPTHVGCIWSIGKFPTESCDAKKPGVPGFLLGIRKDHLETSTSTCQARVLAMLAGTPAIVTTPTTTNDLG